MDTNTGESIYEKKKQAYEVIKQAQKEFFDYVDLRFYSGTNNNTTSEEYRSTHTGTFDQAISVSNFILNTNISFIITNTNTKIEYITNIVQGGSYWDENTSNWIGSEGSTNITVNTNFIVEITNIQTSVIVTNAVNRDVLSMSPKKTIEYLANAAYLSGNTNDFFQYLKQNNLVDRFWEIYHKYDLDAQTKILDIASPAFSEESQQGGIHQKSTSFDSVKKFNAFKWQNGDIVLCQGGSSTVEKVCKMIPGHWKHAGIINLERKKRGKDNFIQSGGVNARDSNDVSISYSWNPWDWHPFNGVPGGFGPGYGVGFEGGDTWITTSSIIVLRVNGATDAMKKKAVQYTVNKYRKPFHFVEKHSEMKEEVTTRWETITVSGGRGQPPIRMSRPYKTKTLVNTSYLLPVDKTREDLFYCSLLVWRAYKFSGIDIEYSKSSDINVGDKDAANAGLLLAGPACWNQTVRQGYGNYEWVTPQNLYDAIKEGKVSYAGGDEW